MLPLSLLNAAQNKPMLVELKNGETFNGHLVNCDNFMNITLREVYQTNADGDRFWKVKECYIRGSTIKYLRVPDTLLDAVKEEQARAREAGKSAAGWAWGWAGEDEACRNGEVAADHVGGQCVACGVVGGGCDVSGDSEDVCCPAMIGVLCPYFSVVFLDIV
ncbi:hypothetical protein EVG20_g7313 [Dentipellis fragilis]|uniref:LSM complex subunit LSM4 n=1 Tax=Dentipellis fragilis TaxID=205917 RepID=A0A4Y9YFV3_9AGAM|nr:hypothetical protein EVG20_g7313 [Dentipellis fragilis]